MMTEVTAKKTAYLRSLCLLWVLAIITACSDQITLPALSNDATILTFGDSLTRGYGAGEAESYPAILEQLSGRKVINGGVSGELSEQGLNRLPALLDQHKPDLLILCHGGNDILRKQDINQMGANIRAMIQLARDRNIPVVLLGVPQPGLFLSSAKIYREIAEATGVIFIEDLIPDVLGDRSLKSDTVHPNGNGYRKIAEEIFSLLMNTGAV
jgi:acyl-CoA thioesterase-1